MPVEFLTSEQESQYGKYNANPTADQLAKYFLLDDQDRTIIFRHRGNHNWLGYAIQLGTVRFLGTFITDIAEVPVCVVNYISNQLNINIKDLYRLINTRNLWLHTQEIRNIYGYSDFSDQPGHFKLTRWLYAKAWVADERPSILFDFATSRCVEQKILLPGVTVMARLIAQIRDRANIKLWDTLSTFPNKNQCQLLEKLLESNNESRKSELDTLRQPPTNPTTSGIIKAIERFDKIYSLGAYNWSISRLPIGRVRTLSRYASMARVQTLSRMNDDRRIAMLAAFAIFFTVSAQDDVIDIMEQFFTELFKKSNRNDQKTRLRTIKDLDKAARQLRDVCALLLDEAISSKDMREVIFSKIPKDTLKIAVQTVEDLTKPKDQTVAFEELFSNYSVVRRFLPKLLTTLEFISTPAGELALLGWNFLAKNETKSSKNKYTDAPLNGITPSWRKIVVNGTNNKINSCAYTFWVIERMLEALKHHDIYIAGTEHSSVVSRYTDPRSQLLNGKAWDSVKGQMLRTLNLSSTAEETLKPLAEKLDKAYMQTAERWEANPNVRIEKFDGRDRLILSPLDRLEESEALKWLRKRVQSLMPHSDLPELVLEVSRWTHFTDAFTHISQGRSRVKDLDVSICAVLISQACNIGLEPVVKPGIPALEYDRLTWVTQNYFRTETIAQANKALVDFNSKLNLAKIWGGGEVASADGLRFVTPVKSTNSRSNSKYFGAGRGVTYYNFTSDQFTGFNGIVIPGTIRDSLYVLQGILEQQTVLQPKEIMTDTAGYSDIIFGLFGLLGYQFSPRLADVGSTRFWKLDPTSDYGVLNKLVKNRIHKDIISRYWDDMLRVAGSLKLGTVNSTQLIHTLQRDGKPTMLGRAIGEFGRIYKTQYLLAYVDDDEYRRRILTQLNRGESRHSLGRAVFYGKRGELHQSYQEGQEDQLSALGLIVNAIVVWNTRYMEVAIDSLQKTGHEIPSTNIQRLSPLGYEHINIMGRYSFNISKEIENGNLRPLMTLDDEVN